MTEVIIGALATLAIVGCWYDLYIVEGGGANGNHHSQ